MDSSPTAFYLLFHCTDGNFALALQEQRAEEEPAVLHACMCGAVDMGPLALPVALVFSPSVLCTLVQNYLSVVEGLAVFQVRVALPPGTISVVKVTQEIVLT